MIWRSPKILQDKNKEQYKRMWVFIACFYLFSLASAGKNDSVNKTSQNIALNDFQHRQNMAALEQRQGDYRVARGLPFGYKPTGPSEIPSRKCENPHSVGDSGIDDNCKEHGKDHAELYDCLFATFGTTNPSQYISATIAKHTYLHMCPKLLCWYYTPPCPRAWKMKYQGAFRVTCAGDTGIGHTWHYILDQLDADSLYDLQSNYYDTNKAEMSLPIMRFHTCQEGKAVPQLIVGAYGLGWIYFIWQRPFENCYASIHYEEEYTVDGHSETFAQADIGKYSNSRGYNVHVKFHPCPKYPNYFCLIVSENVVPFTKLTFKVRTRRFQGEAGDDGDWVSIEFTTDDHGQGFIFCPKQNVFLTLWFLIILIILLLLLLLIAAMLIALLYKRKREIDRHEDETDFEEESIPPSNFLQRIWERLKNFFNELCPRPSKPPPPPPPPPPKPKPKPVPKRKPLPRPRPKPKPKPVPKPVPKPKSPTPTSPPPSASPSPPPPPPPKPKKRKSARKEAKARELAAMETKRMASGVGGVRSRRRKR